LISPIGATQVITITDLELSFQFPIKRDGASPDVAAAPVVAASGVAELEADAIADGLAAGAAGASSLFFPFEITIAPSARTPTSTARRTLLEDPCFGAADGFGAVFAAAGRTAGAGVVETLTRDPPVVGTGGITTFEAALFFTADFFTTFFAVVFLAAAFFTTFFAVVFLVADFFFAAVFLATVFLAAVFLAGDFFAAFFVADFLAVDFFGAAFLAALFFFTATVFLLELYNDGIWEKFNLEISAK
jgi:hypothetical protein